MGHTPLSPVNQLMYGEKFIFVLGMSTVNGLRAGVLEGLYVIFDRASQARQAEFAK